MHELKEHVCIISSFCSLLVDEVDKNADHYRDLVEINTAARHAVAVLRKLEILRGEA